MHATRDKKKAISLLTSSDNNNDESPILSNSPVPVVIPPMQQDQSPGKQPLGELEEDVVWYLLSKVTSLAQVSSYYYYC